LRLGSWWRVLGAAAALSVAELAVERLPFWSGAEDLPMTLHYAGFFVLGMLLARDMPKLQAFYARFSSRTKALLWALALACYTHQAWLLPHSRLQHIPLYRDGLTAVGVSLFIVFALSASRFSAWLGSRPLVFLGKTSYSVYLYHAVILLSLVHLFYGTVPLGLLWLGTGLLTLGVATLSYHLIEVPSIRLGKVVRIERELPSAPPVGLPVAGE
jgi:peptidoglycan/LPS O-acetylase OafA/YrhL